MDRDSEFRSMEIADQIIQQQEIMNEGGIGDGMIINVDPAVVM